MASIKKIEGKTGTSYKITVTKGRDSSGKQIRHFKTWTPDRPMTARQMEKEAQRVAFEFEREIALGFQADDRQTFEQYANYFIGLQEQNGRSKNTIRLYRYVLGRLIPAIGHMKLRDIRPQHLSELNKMLADEGIRDDPASAHAKEGFRSIILERYKSMSEFSRVSGVAAYTISNASRGRGVRVDAAKKMADTLGKDVNDLFEVTKSEAPLSGSTLIHYHSFVTSVLRQAEREMLVPYNAGLKVAAPRYEKKEPDFFQPEDIVKILDALENEPIRWKTLVHMLIVTGCRRGEILGLKWGKVDFENRQILIDTSVSYIPGQGIVEGKTKTKKSRYVAIPDETICLLKKYRAYQTEIRLQNGDAWNDLDYIFTRPNGLPIFPTSLSLWLDSFTDRHGLPHIHPHSFRHSYASALIAAGTDVTTVSKILGHTNVNMTTGTYVHIIEESKRKATECIADVMLRRKKA